MADGRSGGRLGESCCPMVSPLGCKWKVTAVINPFSPLFYTPNIEPHGCSLKDTKYSKFQLFF